MEKEVVRPFHVIKAASLPACPRAATHFFAASQSKCHRAVSAMLAAPRKPRDCEPSALSPFAHGFLLEAADDALDLALLSKEAAVLGLVCQETPVEAVV